MPSNIVLSGTYDYRLVGLSVAIAILASYAALDLGGRVKATRGRTRHLWLAGGSATMGLGIWAMHYVGMLAWKLPFEVFYHWPTVFLSLQAAMASSLVALLVVSRRSINPIRALIGGTLMGIGIAGMHYIGMEAMRAPAMCHYSPGIVTLSIVLAIAISIMALKLTFQLADEHSATIGRKLAGAVLMGAAIPSMHYTGMAAVTMTPMADTGNLVHTVEISSLGIWVIGSVTVIVLSLSILTSLADRRFAAQALELRRLSEALKDHNERLEETVASRTRELADAHARLTIVDRAKSDFLNIISHELRTPLNGLVGVGEIMLDGLRPSEEADEMRRMFEDSRKRMISIVDDALLLTQIHVDGRNLKQAQFPLGRALAKAVTQALPFASAREVRLQAVREDLGLLHGEEGLLIRALHALIETAVKFSDKGGTVWITGRAAAQSVEILIETAGNEIPDSVIGRFFDIFSISEAVTPGGDLGLGSPLASRIVSLFSGAVSVANRQTPGIRLTVRFEHVPPTTENTGVLGSDGESLNTRILSAP